MTAILRFSLLAPAAAAALCFTAGSPLLAQGRATMQVGPAALGATTYVEHLMPTPATPHLGGFLWSAPHPAAVAVAGLEVHGLLRVDPANFTLLGLGAAGGAARLRLAIAVPNQPTLLGAQLDCQSFDCDVASTFWLADNDITLTVVAGPSAALDMAAIAPGSFQMGSSVPPWPTYSLPIFHAPVHPVTITRPFWIGRYEVTQAQFQAVMGSNPSLFQGANHANAPQRPVESVSWANAMAYCNALTAIESAAGRVPAGYQYRLPTEAEWEYCCRAGTTTLYHYGPTLSCAQARIGQVIPNMSCSVSDTAVVGSYAPNAWGLHDMHGNVSEWCMDAWDGTINYPTSAVTDPFVTTGEFRVFRSGGYIQQDWGNSSAHRWGASQAYLGGSLAYWSWAGFRVVLGPVLP
jgi:formylglycine-generating enzyme required for sulfatase activity